MEQREFLGIIQACRRRLNMAGFLKKAVFALSIGMGAGILFQGVAFVLPFYYANLYMGLALLLAFLTACVAACIKRNTMGQAALVMDSFGFQERIVTAYEHLDEKGTLVELQREDAIRQLKANRDRIRIPLLPSWKEMLVFAGLSVVLIVLALMPSAMKERAGQLHGIKEIAKEKEREIEEIKDSLEQLAQEELTPEQQAALQEMIESLQSSMTEYQQAASDKMLAAAAEKLDYKYGNMSSELFHLAQTLENGAEASMATARSIQEMSERLQEMSGKQLAQGSSNGQSVGQEGQNGGSQGGQDGNGQGGGDGEGDQNGGSKDGDGQGSGSQDGDGQGGQSQGSTGGQDGDGQGGGGGSQDGEGQSGQGQSGSGDGDSGNGRGTGSSNLSHDYVSVPNAIADSENLTGNAANHENSEYFRAQNGLTWEGTHISHEAVIGSYERNAYEGIAAGRYPSGMEDVIKEYFASFN